jgi:hypothetical protein
MSSTHGRSRAIGTCSVEGLRHGYVEKFSSLSTRRSLYQTWRRFWLKIDGVSQIFNGAKIGKQWQKLTFDRRELSVTHRSTDLDATPVILLSLSSLSWTYFSFGHMGRSMVPDTPPVESPRYRDVEKFSSLSTRVSLYQTWRRFRLKIDGVSQIFNGAKIGKQWQKIAFDRRELSVTHRSTDLDSTPVMLLPLNSLSWTYFSFRHMGLSRVPDTPPVESPRYRYVGKFSSRSTSVSLYQTWRRFRLKIDGVSQIFNGAKIGKQWQKIAFDRRELSVHNRRYDPTTPDDGQTRHTHTHTHKTPKSIHDNARHNSQTRPLLPERTQQNQKKHPSPHNQGIDNHCGRTPPDLISPQPLRLLRQGKQ